MPLWDKFWGQEQYYFRLAMLQQPFAAVEQIFIQSQLYTKQYAESSRNI